MAENSFNEEVYVVNSNLDKKIERYLNERVLEQIAWYERKGRLNKRIYLSFKVVELLMALSLPFLSGFLTGDGRVLQFVVGILGVLIAAASGLAVLLKAQENWINYRNVAETLKYEKFLFLTGSGDFKGEGGFNHFVDRFENILAQSTKAWMEYVTRMDQVKKTSEKDNKLSSKL